MVFEKAALSDFFTNGRPGYSLLHRRSDVQIISQISESIRDIYGANLHQPRQMFRGKNINIEDELLTNWIQTKMNLVALPGKK